VIIEPYKLRPAPKPLALLTADNRYLDEAGRLYPPGRLPRGMQAWAPAERVLTLLRVGRGRALCWRGNPVRYAPDSRELRCQVLQLPFPDDERALAGLVRWRGWLGALGAAPGTSLGSSSMSLLRATLAEPLWTGVPFASVPPFRFTVGGRQELGPAGAPAAYSGQLRHYDQRAAYAVTLGHLEYGGHWFVLHEGKEAEHAEHFHNFGKMVVCRARVKLAGTRPGPLVRRPRSEPDSQLAYFPEYPSEGTVQGVWSYPELIAAREQGCTVRILEGWFHNNGSLNPHPFEPWWRAVERGRQMHDFAGLLAKATGNALWGQFCISGTGRKQLLFYEHGASGLRRVIRELPVAAGRPRAHDLTEYLTGKVRAELYRFMATAGERLCSAHTDGGWVDCAGSWSYPWRIKERAASLRVLSPQMLAYRRQGEEQECYVVAGWPADGSRELFEREWAQAERMAA
jgi:hypothetical protein